MLSRSAFIMIIFALILLFNAGSAIAAPPNPLHYHDFDPPSLFLCTPLNNADWPTGSVQVITWTYMDFPGPTAKIILYKNGAQVLTVATGVLMDDQPFHWNVPVNLPPGNDYQLQIVSERYPFCKSTSDKFSITTP